MTLCVFIHFQFRLQIKTSYYYVNLKITYKNVSLTKNITTKNSLKLKNTKQKSSTRVDTLGEKKSILKKKITPSEHLSVLYCFITRLV